MIVVDASVAVSALLDDGEARAQLATNAVACPHLVDAEVANAMRALVLREQVTPTNAAAAVDAWRRLGVERVAATGLLGRVWELRPNLTAYDATYVALAEALEVPLVTADARLAQAPGSRCTVTVLRT